MKLSEFDYNLPVELIATHPKEPRDTARLLVLNRQSGEIQDRVFFELDKLLGPNDVLVLNNTKVIPARIFGTVNERQHEVLLIKADAQPETWECWIRGGGKVKIGDIITFNNNLQAVLQKREDDIFFLKFSLKKGSLFDELGKIGEMPIPPYILKARAKKHDEIIDKDDYQTVFAKKLGSVAAPTASLHFTDELLFRLREKGVGIEFVTLHVGLGTFEPVKTDKIEDFKIHSEYFEIDPEACKRLNKAKAAGKRIVAVGTTSVRVLESSAVPFPVIPAQAGIQRSKSDLDSRLRGNDKYVVSAKSGETTIYIYPGYEYRFVDGMITNFHLPKSSLMLLVSAFAGTENVLNAYNHAITEKYRFYSYGDGMLIV